MGALQERGQLRPGVQLGGRGVRPQRRQRKLGDHAVSGAAGRAKLLLLLVLLVLLLLLLLLLPPLAAAAAYDAAAAAKRNCLHWMNSKLPP